MYTKQRLAVLTAVVLLLLGLIPAFTVAADAQFAQIDKAPNNQFYTPILLNGHDGAVFAFNDPDGLTQFRVYGSIGKTKGFFPVTVTANELPEVKEGEQEPEQTFTVELADTRPVRDGQRQVGAPKITTGEAELPDGWENARTRGLVYIENLFGQKEYRAYASFDGENYGYYPTKNSKPAPGALATVVEDMNARKLEEGGKAIRIPAELRNGFQTKVYINLGEGRSFVVSTTYPEIDRDAMAHAQRTAPVKVAPAKTQAPKPTAPPTSGVLKSGSQGADVKKLQERLNALGYSVGSADGKFGPRTEAGIKAFQKANGIMADGVAGENTLNKLYSADAVGPQPAATATVNLTAPTPSPEGPPEFNFEDHVTMNLMVSSQAIKTTDSLTLKSNYVYDGAKAPVELFFDASMLLMDANRKTVEGKIAEGNNTTLTFTNLPAGKYTAFYHVTGGEHYNTYKEIEIVVSATTTTDTVEETEAVPFETERRANNNMLTTDEDKVVQDGKDGLKTITYTITYADGKEVERVKKGEVITTQPVKKIVEYGTKNPDGSEDVVTIKEESETEAVPFETERKANESMLKTDPEKVVQEGVDGVKTIVYKVTYTDNKETKREKISESITTQPVKKIVEYGSKEPVAEEPGPIEITFSISPSKPNHGDDVVLSWSVKGGDGKYDIGVAVRRDYGIDGGLKNAPNNSSYTYKNIQAGNFVFSVGVNDFSVYKEIPVTIANPVNEGSTFTYEYVSVTGGNFQGTWSPKLASQARAHAMACAKRGSIFHSSGGFGAESIVTGGGTDLGYNLIAHQGLVGTQAYYGTGAVARIETMANGSVIVKVYAVAQSSDKEEYAP